MSGTGAARIPAIITIIKVHDQLAPMKTALLSVWDKRGLIELARGLHQAGYILMSSGGTGKALAAAGIPFREVQDYTGFPEVMGGRVKTLHPRIHGGLLGRRGVDDEVAAALGITYIDLLVVNLYPFEEKAAQALPIDDLIEFIDVGGPAMIRAGAKNFRHVTVVVDPDDYPHLLEEIARDGPDLEKRGIYAARAFARTAAYDAAISNYLHGIGKTFPTIFTVQFRNGRSLRYGENPHQIAAVYGESGIAAAVPFQGKAMSYNNYLDLNAACGLVREFAKPCAVVVKHNNPCGVAIGAEISDAYVQARDVDPMAAYGSVVALNRAVDAALAEEICSTYVEVVAAPGFDDTARGVMHRKENMRALLLPDVSVDQEMRSISGGILVQRTPPYQESWVVRTKRAPDPREMDALSLAWKVCAHTRSNAIIIADEKRTLGIGAGQMSRVDAAQIAVRKSRFPLLGSSAASDAFLPFPDALEEVAAAGVTALIQPGGSIRDNEVIAAADRLEVAMLFTGVRHFRH